MTEIRNYFGTVKLAKISVHALRRNAFDIVAQIQAWATKDNKEMTYISLC